MKILAVSDEENNALWSERVREIAQGVDLIVSCGDLRNEYLEFLLTMINAGRRGAFVLTEGFTSSEGLGFWA